MQSCFNVYKLSYNERKTTQLKGLHFKVCALTRAKFHCENLIKQQNGFRYTMSIYLSLLGQLWTESIAHDHVKPKRYLKGLIIISFIASQISGKRNPIGEKIEIFFLSDSFTFLTSNASQLSFMYRTYSFSNCLLLYIVFVQCQFDFTRFFLPKA